MWLLVQGSQDTPAGHIHAYHACPETFSFTSAMPNRTKLPLVPNPSLDIQRSNTLAQG
jgi:hypothetical protein